ncbi:MAG: polyprenyl synthetase family protein [Filimonas sp.]|nr:polyprenyl synthetase family protein [Filimonas sp.]
MNKETYVPDTNTTLNQYPSTWPDNGPIDLHTHDLPHNGSVIEWWYQNCHVTSRCGKRFSLFASFFRVTTKKEKQTGNSIYTHSVIWSLSDIDDKKYYPSSLVDPNTPTEILEIITNDEKNNKHNTNNKSFRNALRAVYEKGNVPLPDVLLKQAARIGTDSLSLEYDDIIFKKEEQGNYHLQLNNTSAELTCNLRFVPLVNAVRHGNNGFVKGIRNEEMFYYFIPQCKVNGDIRIGNEVYEVEGNGWYDHEFSKPADETTELEFKQDTAWNWIALQLDNGYQISGYDLFDNTRNGDHAGGAMILIDPNGNSVGTEQYTFAATHYWTSSKTFITYPVSWLLEIPGQHVSFAITADFPEQEFITILSMPAFWEGSIHATGSFMGVTTCGLGYVERSGFNGKENIETFLKAVGKATQQAVESILPMYPTDAQFHRLVNSPVGVDFFSTAEKEAYVSSVVKPIREIVDRSKKAWRSYVFLACIDAVGGNSQPFMDWLAVPEFIHTGSLIVDDVQDRSDTRRGGSALHLLYGEPLAINAGNICYFIGELYMRHPQLPERTRLTVYEQFFEMMRAAHVGQALDISGLHQLMPDAVSKGDCSILEKRIYTIHRLKTATPACSLAKLGGLIGGGQPEEIDALGSFFEAIGIAYQIMDDVLNLQGYDNNLKDKGEDITAGKITMPVAKAMGLLSPAQREYVWQTIQTMPVNRTVIESVIRLLQNCGAIDACRQEAEELVEMAWRKIDMVLPDSFFKIRLRAFSRYALKKE